MIIDFVDETQSVSSETVQLIDDILKFAKDYLKLSSVIECSVSFVDNERIREINRDYRGKDVATDVISFALDDDDSDVSLMPSDMTHHLGDIIISIDKAKEQAQAYNHSFEREIGFLALHGFLHLNGYDHMSEEEEKEMFSLQDEILKAMGLDRNDAKTSE